LETREYDWLNHSCLFAIHHGLSRMCESDWLNHRCLFVISRPLGVLLRMRESDWLNDGCLFAIILGIYRDLLRMRGSNLVQS